MSPLLVDALTVAGFCAALYTGYWITTRAGKLLVAAELSGGCPTCYLLARLPRIMYWLVRTHLRQVASATEKARRKTAA